MAETHVNLHSTAKHVCKHMFLSPQNIGLLALQCFLMLHTDKCLLHVLTFFSRPDFFFQNSSPDFNGQRSSNNKTWHAPPRTPPREPINTTIAIGHHCCMSYSMAMSNIPGANMNVYLLYIVNSGTD